MAGWQIKSASGQMVNGSTQNLSRLRTPFSMCRAEKWRKLVLFLYLKKKIRKKRNRRKSHTFLKSWPFGNFQGQGSLLKNRVGPCLGSDRGATGLVHKMNRSSGKFGGLRRSASRLASRKVSDLLGGEGESWKQKKPGFPLARLVLPTQVTLAPGWRGCWV